MRLPEKIATRRQPPKKEEKGEKYGICFAACVRPPFLN
jgi:hypothetical protein